MGLVTSRIPNSKMLAEAHALSEGAYYQSLIGGSGQLSNVWIDLTYDTLCAFREACRLSKAASADMTRRTNAGERFGDWVLDEAIRFPMTEATVVQTHYGRTITQGSRSNLFRGERQMWPESRSSLDRELHNIEDPIEKKRYELVAAMRVAAFSDLLMEFGAVRRWCTVYDVDPLFIPLAQHYGIQTHMIDFTDDFDTALFFATCIYDETSRAYRPLRADEIGRGTPSEYGVIFNIPVWQAEFVSVMLAHSPEKTPEDHFTVDPIGYQPFMRCYLQHGYGIQLSSDLPLQQNKYFEKLRFKQSVELSEEVFYLMDGGRMVFPDEGLNSIDDIIDEIASSWSFSEKEFDLGYMLAGGDESYGNPRLALELADGKTCRGHTVRVGHVEKAYSISRQRKRAVDHRYKDLDLERASGTKHFWHKPRMV